MKYCIILGDGMADEPSSELGGRTPLEAARTPNMDLVAREGAMGMVKTVPDGFQPGSDIANLSILGYDPALYYTGRGALEAASMGVELGERDVAYRCNLVTTRDGIMYDFNAGHISSDEGASLLKSLNEHLSGMTCYSGVSYRNLLVLHDGLGCNSTPPHDITGSDFSGYLPTGSDSKRLVEAIEISRRIFIDHPVNLKRVKEGKLPATEIWPWSGGKKPTMPSFQKLFNINGGIISAVDLLFGIGVYAGMEIIKVPGATGFIDTDYQAKADYALNALKRLDFVFIHIEAPDEAGHMGSLDEKIKAIEGVDGIVGRILREFNGRIAILPDHPTPVRLKTHTSSPVPFAIYGRDKDSTKFFSEKEGKSGVYGEISATSLIPLLISQ